MALDAGHKEFIIEYCFSIATCLVRFFARWKAGSLRTYKLEDLFIIIAIIAYSAQLGSRSLTVHGTNVGITPEIRAKLTPARIHELEEGSIGLLVGWTMFATTTWCLKASMMCYLWHLVVASHRWQRYLLTFCAVLAGLTYVAAILTVYLTCLPFEKHWQVDPAPPKLCLSLVLRQNIVGIPNLVTDAILFILPIPLLVSVRLPMKTKLVTGFLLCSGVFIMIIIVIRLYYVNANGKDTSTSTRWSTRELMISFFVVNAPHLKPLFTKIWSPNASTDQQGRSILTIGSGGYRSRNGPGMKKQTKAKRYQNGPTDTELIRGSPNSSQERILESGNNIPLEQMKQQEQVKVEAMPPGTALSGRSGRDTNSEHV